MTAHQPRELEAAIVSMRSVLPPSEGLKAAPRARTDQPYAAMSEIAVYVVDLLDADPATDLGPFFDCVETVLSRASSELRKQIVVGLIEDIQNLSLNRFSSLGIYDKWLREETRLAWNAVIEVWNGNLTPKAFNRGMASGRWDS